MRALEHGQKCHQLQPTRSIRLAATAMSTPCRYALGLGLGPVRALKPRFTPRLPHPGPRTTPWQSCLHAARSQTRPFSRTAPHSKLKTIDQIRARNRGGPFNLTAAIIFIAAAGGLYAYFTYEKERLARKRIAEQTKGIGKPKVGGPFQLIDQEGRPFGSDDMLGKYALVCHFAYLVSHCKGTTGKKPRQRRVRDMVGLGTMQANAAFDACRSTLASHTAQTFVPTSSTKWPSCTTRSSPSRETSCSPL